MFFYDIGFTQTHLCAQAISEERSNFVGSVGEHERFIFVLARPQFTLWAVRVNDRVLTFIVPVLPLVSVWSTVFGDYATLTRQALASFYVND